MKPSHPFERSGSRQRPDVERPESDRLDELEDAPLRLQVVAGDVPVGLIAPSAASAWRAAKTVLIALMTRALGAAA